MKTIIAPGQVNTPKQLALDITAQKIYFCDREGLLVYRCSFDGSDLEILISAGNPNDPLDAHDGTKRCVGVAVAQKLGKFYFY